MGEADRLTSSIYSPPGPHLQLCPAFYFEFRVLSGVCARGQLATVREVEVGGEKRKKKKELGKGLVLLDLEAGFQKVDDRTHPENWALLLERLGDEYNHWVERRMVMMDEGPNA